MVGDLPVKQWRSGSLSCSVWSNKRTIDRGDVEEEVEFRTVSLRKSWKQSDGWHDQTISNIRKNDLAKIVLLLTKAQEELLLTKEEG